MIRSCGTVRRKARAGTAMFVFLITSVKVNPQPTAVSYQGYLEENNQPVEGLFDLEFSLFDAPDAGIQIGNSVNADDLQVTEGLFSTSLDFGPGAFDATPRYLQIAVRPGDSTNAFSTLEERVLFQSVPYSQLANHATTANEAIMAQTATSAATATTADNATTADSATSADNAQALQGFEPGDFSIANHSHSQLSTPNRLNLDIVRTTNSGDVEIDGEILPQNGVTFQNNVRVTNLESDELLLESTTNDTAIQFQMDAGNVNAIGFPKLGGHFQIAPGPSTHGKGSNLRLWGGEVDEGLSGDGGDILLLCGSGSGPEPSNGGSIIMEGGLAGGGGARGIVMIRQSNLAVRRNDSSHPIHVGTDALSGNGAHVTIGGMWMNGSDRDSKTDFEELDTGEILRKVAELPVTAWRYKSENEDVRHIGPTAQDFMAAFELGESEKHIGTVDAVGVALAAIQELHAETRLLRTETRLLAKENSELRARLADLESDK